MGIKAFPAERLKSRARGLRNNRTQFLGPLLPNYTSEPATQALTSLFSAFEKQGGALIPVIL